MSAIVLRKHYTNATLRLEQGAVIEGEALPPRLAAYLVANGYAAFVNVDDDDAPEVDGWNSEMSVSQLMAFADRHGIEIKPRTPKAAIIDILMAHG